MVSEWDDAKTAKYAVLALKAKPTLRLPENLKSKIQKISKSSNLHIYRFSKK